MHRIHNFSAGPGALPLPVLQTAQQELVDYRGTGMSILEMSHRGGAVEAMHDQTIADLRALMGIPDDYAVLFFGGGARGQFAMIPWNLRPPGRVAAYLDTGTWSSGAIAEAKKCGDVVVPYSSEAIQYRRVPADGDFEPVPDAAYLHYTSNNTIYGTQYPAPPQTGGAPLVCDMSSDILSRPVDVARFLAIYAGAQKNMGPAGVTVVIVRRDALDGPVPGWVPETMHYAAVSKANSMLNTPPVFAIYLVGLVARHLLDHGGLEQMAATNARKAERLYRVIDESGGFYVGHAEPKSRSEMNVTFRLRDGSLEKALLAEAEGAALSGLKGHRSVGGLRASIYNAVPEASVGALCEFLLDFQRRRG